jgi:hypothetical protein
VKLNQNDLTVLRNNAQAAQYARRDWMHIKPEDLLELLDLVSKNKLKVCVECGAITMFGCEGCGPQAKVVVP